MCVNNFKYGPHQATRKTPNRRIGETGAARGEERSERERDNLKEPEIKTITGVSSIKTPLQVDVSE